MKEGKHAKKKFRVVEIYTVLLLVSFIFMSIGYAQISDINMIVTGNAKATAQTGVFIYDVGDTVVSGGANASQSTVNGYFGSNLDTKVTLGTSGTSTISYKVNLYNNSPEQYMFVGIPEPVKYDNTGIEYVLSDNMVVGDTVINANGGKLEFDVTFKYKNNTVTSNKVLNSILNFRFKEIPRVTLNNGVDTKVIDKDIYAIYPGVTAYEGDFIVENVDSGFNNKVDMKYTLSVDNAIELPEGITESPLIVEIDNDSNTSNSVVISNIALGSTNVTHTYKLRVKWNEDVKYNSADFAGKNFKYKVNFIGTPTDDKYLNYTLNKSFIVDITTAPLNFNVSLLDADIFMESNGKASLELAVNNSSDANYSTGYNVKIANNSKFTPSISGVAISSAGVDRTLNVGENSNDNFTIDFAADVNNISRKESVNVVLDLTSPYTKEITIPVNVRSIVMSSLNADGNEAIGNNAQVTNGNVNVTINFDGTYLNSGNNRNLQYSVGENNWQTIAISEISDLNTTNAKVTKAISVNGNVYARYFDGTNGYGTTQISIDNIDKVSPNAFNLSTETTTYSVKVSGETTDKGSTGTKAEYVDISGYQYQIKNDSGTVLASWTPKQAENNYTFIGTENDATLQQVSSTNWKIEQGKTYIVSMRAVDKAGNITEATSKSVITDTVADSAVKIGTSASTKEPVQGPVTVRFTNNSGKTDLILKYQIGSTSDNGWLEYDEVTGVSVATNKIVYARLFDEAGQYTNTASVEVTNIDKLEPNTPTIAYSNVEQTTFTLTASASDKAKTSDYDCSGIARYDFYIDGELKKSLPSTEGTVEWNATEADGITAGTTYKAKVIVYDAAENSTPSSEIEFTTKSAIIDIATSDTVKVGDFVNYSVEVDGVTYDKWRILHKDINGYVEIVCYNGPKYTLSGKTGYAECISLLNSASLPYVNGTYGVDARHLGSNPTSPSDYATIQSRLVVFNQDYVNTSNSNYKYLEQTHYQKANASDPDKDVDALNKFAVSPYLKEEAWLAARHIYPRATVTEFYVRTIKSTGEVFQEGLFFDYSTMSDGTYSQSIALAPVVKLKVGIQVKDGNGSEGNPWQLKRSGEGNAIPWDGTVATAFAGGSGTEDDPYLIETPQQLAYLAKSVNVDGNTYFNQSTYSGAYFKQVADIDLGGVQAADGTWSGTQWTPIGNSTTYFRGNYDGDGYKISNLYINLPNNNYVGLFGYLGADATNIIIENGYVVGNNYVGSLVGYFKSIPYDFAGCKINSSVVGNNYVGGLIGYVDCSYRNYSNYK